MKISVIVRTCNRPDFLEQALCSVELQTHTDWEVIVFDDGDSSQNQKIVNEFKERNPFKRVVYYTEGGKYFLFKNSWLIAPKLSEGELMIRLDDDDILDTETLEFIDKVFIQTPELDFAYGQSVQFRGTEIYEYVDINTPHDFPKTTATWEGYVAGYPYKHPWRFKQNVFDEPRHPSSIIHSSKLNQTCVFHPYIMRTSSVLKVVDKITVTSKFVDDLEFLGSLDNLGLAYNRLNKILTYVRKHEEGQVTDPGKEIDGQKLWDDILHIRDKVDELRPSGLEFKSTIVDIDVNGNYNDGLTPELQQRFDVLLDTINETLHPSKRFEDRFDWRLF